MFPMACHRTLIGLVGGHLTLIGYSIMREGFYQALAMFPLPLVAIKMMAVFKQQYVSPGVCVSTIGYARPNLKPSSVLQPFLY